MQTPQPLDEFVEAVIARAQLAQLDPSGKKFTVGRGARGVRHIVPQKAFRSGRLVRAAETTLCRGVHADMILNAAADVHTAPTCRRCQEVAERIIRRGIR